MTIRNLDALFKPAAIALVGASNQPNSVGAMLARNLFESGFHGPILAVNPHEDAIRSTLNYRSVGELPITPDLAVVATPPPTVPGIIADLGARGCRAAVVVTAGFGEGSVGESLHDKMLAAAKPHLFRIVGPNCLGFISPAAGINASFAHLTPRSGELAFVTQSGALATGILDWAHARGIGFSHVASLGDMSDVDFGDMLDYLALDPKTSAILLYIESVTAPRKFMSAGRIAARAKPVIVIKAGRSEAGARATLSHTGALAGSDAVYDAALRRAGMLRVRALRELFDAVTALSARMRAEGERLAIVTNGGGAGVLAVDALDDLGGALPNLSAETRDALGAVLPPAWSKANPVDILGDATEERYRLALDIVLADPDTDAVLVMNCPTAVTDSLKAAEAVVGTHERHPRKPVLTCWLGERAAAPSRRLFGARRIPTFETPDEAARAFMHLVQYRRNQDLLMETPPAVSGRGPGGREAVRSLCRAVLAEGRSILTEPEAKQLLSAYGIPTVETLVAADAAEAEQRAAEIGSTVVLKILSPDITHKSDVGGVRLGLKSPDMVAAAAQEMREAARTKMPGARLKGFTVQPMVDWPGAHELILGIAQDQTFGPILLFGQGGIHTEMLADRAIGLPPLNMVLAREMIARTRVARLLAGHRNRPPVDTDAIASILVSLSELVIDVPDIVELDINPLLASGDRLVALDARVVVRDMADGAGRLAIQPYPSGLEHEIETDAGRVRVRPIRPEDEPQLVAMVKSCAPQDIRMRFLGALKDVPRAMAARLSQIDYDREMALVALEGEAILGVARIIATPDNDRAEFAVLVRSDMKGRGLGFALMKDIIAVARSRGIGTIHGDVLAENTTMLAMAAELGFTRQPPEGGIVRVELAL